MRKCSCFKAALGSNDRSDMVGGKSWELQSCVMFTGIEYLRNQ
jgi:hypothetical protein